MNVLREITDKDLETEVTAPAVYKERGAARAVIFDTERKIALLHSTVHNYHKLPGGGIEEGEEIEAALRREALEEIGCEITNLRELGIIEEYRNRDNVGEGLHQTSYCYIADLAGEKGESHLEEAEIAEGFETVWMSLPEAIKMLVVENAMICMKQSL